MYSNKQLNSLIKKICREYDIQIDPKRYRSPFEGTAYFDERLIKIPNITNLHSFMIALHEIGHIVEGRRKFIYLTEYVAERWAINKAKELGIDCSDYKICARNFIISHLAEEHNRGWLNLAFVSKEIKDFIGNIDIEEWKGYVIEIRFYDDFYLKGQLFRIKDETNMFTLRKEHYNKVDKKNDKKLEKKAN